MKESLSVCIVTQQFRSVVSGIGLHARNLLTGLLADGHHITLITPSNQMDSEVSREVEVFTVPSALFQNSQARWISLAWSFARKLKKIDATRRFDIVHFTDAREAFCFAGHHPAVIVNVNDYYATDLQLLRRYRHYYGDYWERLLYYAFLHQCEKYGLPRLNAIIANSEYTLRAIQQAYGINPSNLYQCPKCIAYSPSENDLQFGGREKLVLFVGGNMQRKGLETLIRAAPKVLEALPDVQFLVVGQDRNLPRMQALSRRLGVADGFEFYGLITNKELQKLYRKASVFAMPSLMEAFGVVFLEAMAHGIPVVATNVGGVPELIENGKNGLMVEPGDSGSLADALLSLLRDSELAARLSKHGISTAQGFGIQQMLTCTYQVYAKGLSKSAH